jgi:hypothetical protein
MNTITTKRWSKISLRTLHLLSIAGVGGGVLLGLEQSLWINYWWMALASGGLMMLMDIISNPVWIVQVRGLAILLKLVLLVFLLNYPDWDGFLLVVIIIISSVISHAPAKLRYYSIYHRRVLYSTNNTRG